MLIVSQNKMKTTEKMEIWIEELWENTEFNKKSFYIKNPIGTLGRYHTEERAKEVLQEIVKKYSSYLELKGGIAIMQGQMDIQPNIFNIPKVYEMPEE